MKKAREFMDDFMTTWNNMKKYHDIKLNPVEPNYDEFERAFSEEKKIVLTQRPQELSSEVIESRSTDVKLLEKKL